MATADLLNVPKSASDWNFFSFNNRDAVQRIKQAILTQQNIDLIEYQLDPVDLSNPTFFLQNNQQSHTDFNGVLGLQSTDLLDVDLKDERQLQSWTYLNWLEIQQAEFALKT